MTKIDPVLQVSSGGIPIDNKAVGLLYSTYALIYNSAFVRNHRSRGRNSTIGVEEWKGKIGFIRPDAKSSASWRSHTVC